MIHSRDEIRPEAVASHYDELDAFYRDVWGEHVHHGLWLTGRESTAEAVRQLVRHVADAARIAPGMRICDIGCGYGATARQLVEECQAVVTGITVSAAQHAFAAGASRNGGPEFRLGDWLENDFPDASFDAAIAIESSEHMPDLAAFFTQAHRVLKPGAPLVVCAWLTADLPTGRQRRWLLEPICREGRMPRMGSFADYERHAADAGFRCERSEDMSKKVARTWSRIAWTFGKKLLTRPSYLRFLVNAHARNRIFALTIFRLLLACRTGAMRYGIFTFTQAPVPGPARSS